MQLPLEALWKHMEDKKVVGFTKDTPCPPAWLFSLVRQMGWWVKARAFQFDIMKLKELSPFDIR